MFRSLQINAYIDSCVFSIAPSCNDIIQTIDPVLVIYFSETLTFKHTDSHTHAPPLASCTQYVILTSHYEAGAAVLQLL